MAAVILLAKLTPEDIDVLVGQIQAAHEGTRGVKPAPRKTKVGLSARFQPIVLGRIRIHLGLCHFRLEGRRSTNTTGNTDCDFTVCSHALDCRCRGLFKTPKKDALEFFSK